MLPIARFSRSRRIHSRLDGHGVAIHSGPLIQRSITSTASLLLLSPTLADTQSVSPTLIGTSGHTSSEGRYANAELSSGRRFTPATLSLLPRAVEIQDLVVLSFLFLEKNRRSKDGSGFSGERTTYSNIVPMSAC